jgi:hypothetical protein
MPITRLSLFRQPSPGLQLARGGFVLAAKKSNGNGESAQLLLRPNSPQLEKLPDGVPFETCQCRRATQSPAFRKPMLELAKGFEPLTL